MGGSDGEKWDAAVEREGRRGGAGSRDTRSPDRSGMPIASSPHRERGGGREGAAAVSGAGPGRWGGAVRGLALALVTGAALVGCGGEDEPATTGAEDARPEATETGAIRSASPAVGSPARGGLTQDLESSRVTIANGKLDPDRIEAQAGIPFVLTVEGDGQTHTFVVQDLVAETQIAAQGATEVQLNVPEGTEGDKQILLDGQEAGTLSVQGAGGVPDS